MTTKTTKMKGLFKGLRYISQIFEEEKDDEIQIGFPTDVKHVAHIGWDGPAAVNDNPSWMKEFKPPTGFSAPLSSNGDQQKGEPEIKWVSEDSTHSRRSNRVPNSPGRDNPDMPPRSRRHHSSESNSTDSPRKKDPTTRSRNSRRNHSKDSSEGGSVKSNRHMQESGPSDSPSRGLPPDAARKSRRKKSKETDGGGSSRRSRAAASSPDQDDGFAPSQESCSHQMATTQSMNDLEAKKSEL